MVELTRCVRFCVNDPAPPGIGGWGAPDNTFAAYPSMRGLGRYYELEVRCRGGANPATGYFLNIKAIDQAVRSVGVPLIERACRERPGSDAGIVLAQVLGPVNDALGGVVAAVRWKLTPYYSIEMSPSASVPSTHTSPAAEPRVLMRQQFEFAAAHRLHSPSLSDEENRATFGKCNNASGHGHNYRIEACVESPLGREGARFTLADLERVTSRTILDRFDHKHLNRDTSEFDIAGGGVNPSVENIARVCFDLLAPAIIAACPVAKLRDVTVWETDKTWCTYPAGERG